jgi:hypothetical protein
MRVIKLLALETDDAISILDCSIVVFNDTRDVGSSIIGPDAVAR